MAASVAPVVEGKYGSNKVGSGKRTFIKPSRASISEHKSDNGHDKAANTNDRALQW